MVRGDGHLGSSSSPRHGRGSGAVHGVRLASADVEALVRIHRYLDGLRVRTQEFVVREAVAGRRHTGAVGTLDRAAVPPVADLIGWPLVPSDDWRNGFLAGIFDAEGSWSRGVLRIANADRAIIDRVGSSLGRFGFAYVVERPRPGPATPAPAIRLTGGLREHLRFLHTVDPAITRKRTIPEGTALTSDPRLRITAIEPIGVDMPMYDISTGTGDFIANGVVSHNCFARNTHTYLDMDPGEDFDSKIVVKVNAPELLRRELARRTWKGEHIALGTNVDPYQRAEGRYRLTRGILEALRDAANPFSILTKGSLILRDLDVLTSAAEVTDVSANVSVGSIDKALWRSVESGTPSPQKRLEVCAKLDHAGVGCGVLMAPILPFLSDAPSQLEATVRAIAEAGAVHVAPIVLHLRPGAREWYLAWLEREHPSLVPKYAELYGRGSYAPKAYQQRVSAQVLGLARRFGIGQAGPNAPRHVRHAPIRRPAAEPSDQLELL
jgi:DNA repair photolyase